ncbi:glucosyl transferase [Actinoplanes sp. NBRC 14428]|uniref:Dolichol-phosphate mannosyltransferase n=1 Tax=Pseudosporangium ferrugineum TaxID=439699 RepID=A0A2T0S828_9ACTN|nr:glycosyltransferase family 2 protein [Pseudosporangium ferrugineum]PRY29581.1 dolichol-phosphate mannosyltransferase [Pseudosporangium ferrugineum]BCJ52662.1 glucosyl transferase [Actinoplanes sp. NBRC 14428]
MTGVVLSVVVPMFNEEAVVPALVARLRPVLDGLAVAYEVVAVDDGSGDRTAALLFEQGRTWPELRLLRLRRNSGHQAALTAGLHRARGDWVVSIDADLQDPPEAIAPMLAAARERGLDVVYGVRSDRSSDSLFKRSTAGAYYRLMRRLIGGDVPAQAGDFRLLSREVVEVLKVLPERTPVYRLLVPSLGFASGSVSYVREKRAAGETKYPLRKMAGLAWDSAADFSAAPLRLATWLGALAFLACLGLMVFGLVVWANGTVIPGWTSLFLAVLLLAAVQLICLGLLGEYVARIYRTVQNRPAFHIGFDSLAPDPGPVDIPRQRPAAAAR